MYESISVLTEMQLDYQKQFSRILGPLSIKHLQIQSDDMFCIIVTRLLILTQAPILILMIRQLQETPQTPY